MMGEVVWTASAADDLERVIDYVAAESPLDAARLLDRLLASAESLTELPSRGRRVPELADHVEESVRELVVAPYRLVYEVVSAPRSQVLLLAVVDGRRDLQDLLLERAMGRSRS